MKGSLRRVRSHTSKNSTPPGSISIPITERCRPRSIRTAGHAERKFFRQAFVCGFEIITTIVSPSFW